MENSRGNMYWIGVACLLLAWVILFAGYILGAGMASAVPLWLPLVLAFAAGGLTATSNASSRSRVVLATAVVLLAAALALVRVVDDDDDELHAHWRSSASEHIATTLLAVGEEVARLEAQSASIGRRISAVVGTPGFDVDDTAQQFRMFELLDSLAAEASGGGALPPGTEIGIQVFTPSGARAAWAGWPQSISRLERVYFTAGQELTYSRKVSLYQILSQVIPLHGADGRVAAVALVDLPLEVNFRVNNRFLKSASLADNIPTKGISAVTFEYFPTPGNLPERLVRFKQAQERARAAHEARLARLSRAQDSDDDEVLSVATGASSLSYFPFPEHMEVMSELSGDGSLGLHGRVMVRSPQGNPLLAATATSHPYRHFRSERDAEYLLWARTLIVLTLFVLFVLLMSRVHVSRSAAMRWAGSGLLVAFMIILRYALLSFRTVSPAARLKIFDPTVFATPALGGIMRSAGDLLITSIFFVVMLYGVSRIARAGDPEGGGGDDDSSDPVTITAVALKTLLMVAVGFGVYEMARRFTETVVVNANPRLLGETMNITDPQVLVLHMSMFLMLTGLILAGIFLAWGVMRVIGMRGAVRATLPALAILGLIAAVSGRWEIVFLAVPVLLFIAYAPRFVRREDLVSFVIVSFYLVIVSSGTAYVFLTHNYDSLRKNFVLEKSSEILNPSDNWKVVILEDVLGEYAGRHDIRQAMRSPGSQDVQRLAFDMWAEGPLSLLGYSCAIHVITAEDEVISDFAVDMPYRARIAEGGERIDTPVENDWVVLDLTRTTPQGIVRFYRGILSIHDTRVVGGARIERHVIGKVIIDLPFFFESLRLAARTGPRTPEVLRNVQEGGVAPRIEEPEALLLARINDRQVYESSSDNVAVGSRVSNDLFERAGGDRWPMLRAGARNYRVVIRQTGVTDQYLLAGFVVPKPQRHLLRWSTLLSLYLSYTFAIIVAIMACGAIPRFKELLPTLTPGRKLGFQQKLLASFLVVALVPAIILGLFAVGFIKDRFVEENKKEALYRSFSARKAFVNLLHGELQFLLNGDDFLELFASSEEPVRVVGDGRIVVLHEDAAGGGIVSVSGDSVTVAVGSALDEVSSDDLFIVRQGEVAFIGVVSAPVRVSTDEWSGSFYVYYAREIDGALLGEIADQVGADVNIYDEGSLVASSREGLLAGGFISAVMNSRAFMKVSMLGSDHTLATERAGRYDYQVAYLPVTRGLGAKEGVTGQAYPTRSAMSVPLVFRPESYYMEVQKATSIVLSIFALLFAATVALGLILARGIFEPLRGLVAGTQRISQGDYDVRLPGRRRDEIGTVVSAFNEMTQRVAESRRVLDERRRYLETILENIGTGVISTDGSDHLRAVNTSAERILGVAAADVLGRPVAELVDAGFGGAIFALLREGAAKDLVFVADEVELERDGKRATIKYMLTQLRVEDRYLGTVFVFEDLTELIQSKKLSAWVEMARQIAHEIKNPLTPIRISTQFMQRAYEQKPDQFERVFKEGTSTILHQVDVLKRIASEFSSYGRMQQLDVGPHPLEPLIRNIVRPYEKNDAGVVLHYENGTPGATVVIDPEAFRKICANLIENALEAMPDGGDLHVSCVNLEQDGNGFVQVSFRDSGAGLSAEVADKLFEPYFSTKTTGTGLGLAICRTLSHEMGGDVTVENLSDGSGVVATLTVRQE